MPQKPCPAESTLGEAEAAGNILEVDVKQLLLGKSGGVDSLSEVPLLDVPLPDVPLTDIPLPTVSLPDIPLPDVPLSHIPLPEVRPDGSVHKE
jgi:hypothetical protein